VFPPFGTPVSNELLATLRQPGAQALLQLLRTELHAHKITGDMVYGDGRPRLNLGVLDVWFDDPAGTFLCWGPSFLEESADHAVIGENDLPRVAERIAELHATLTTASAGTTP
jgi:hypothetical protein